MVENPALSMVANPALSMVENPALSICLLKPLEIYIQIHFLNSCLLLSISIKMMKNGPNQTIE